MDKDKMLVEMGYAIRKRVTSREEFLRTMSYIIPWTEWVEHVRPFAPEGQEEDRQVLLLLRMYLLQQWFGLPDDQLEDAIYDSYAMWLFVGLNTLAETLPARTVYTAFRRGLERSEVQATLSEAVENFLARYGRKMVRGSMVEASIIEETEAPPAPDQPPQDRIFAPGRQQQPEEAETIRQIEERLRRLETEDKPPVRRQPQRAPEDDYDEPPRPRRRGGFGRFLVILLVLAILAGAAYVVYDYMQTGTWLRWLQQAESAPAQNTATPEPLATFQQRIIPDTGSPSVTMLQPEMTPSPTIPAQTAPATGNLLQQILQTEAPVPTGGEVQAGMLGGMPYDARDEIQANIARLEAGVAPAVLITSEASPGKKISITIDGMHEAETMRGILDLLAEHDTQVIFFPTGLETADTPELVREIADAGHAIGNYTLRGAAHMETEDATALVENFTMAGKIIETAIGKAPVRLKANATEYTQDFLMAAAASGLPEVVQGTSYLTYHSFTRYEDALSYVNRLPYGSIVSVKLSGVLDPSEYQPLEIIEDPAIDKEASVPATISPVEGLSEAERLLLVIQWLLMAVDNADFSPESVALREANGGALAETTQLLRTTQPAVAYTYSGNYERPAEVQAILDSLSAIGGKATFFVTLEDITLHQATLQTIVDRGHSLGLALSSSSARDFYTAAHMLLQGKAALSAAFGLEPRTVMQTGGEITDALREAASALNLLLVGADLTFTREETREAPNAQSVITSIYGTNTEGFQRGKILRFRLGYMTGETILGELIPALEGTRNAYAVVDVHTLATNTAHLYTYPLPEEEILPEVRGRIFEGQLTATGDDFVTFASERYLGNPAISDTKRLPGFTRQEIYALDTSGRISGASGVAFLTFDDWGTDVGVTKLLDVLRRHNVKATFFVRTEYVPNNPNLLRAIAMEGHEVASHTHTHLQLANELEGWVFEELTDGQAAALRADIKASWDVLEHVVGDIRLDNGKPALSTLFRPPTLAVGKKGMEAVFDMGMTYIVSGDYTSQDYKAEDKDALRRALRLNIWDGSVAVLHFSDNAIYTADALDEYLTLNAAGENRKIYTYARLSDYLDDTEAKEAGQ